MELGTLLVLLLVLACPLMMVWMMRGHGGHGAHAGHAHGHGPVDESSGTRSLDALRRARAELDDQIERLERSETETTTRA